jgi:hypothetical protein
MCAHANNENINNEHLNAHNDAVIFANYMYNYIINLLPPHCTVRPLEEGEWSSTNIIIECAHPQSNHIGHVILRMPGGHGFVHMMGAINSFNGFLFNMTVNNAEDMFEVIAFCQNLLQFQPDAHILDYVRIPNNLLNHWCVPDNLRALNLHPPVLQN